MKALAISPRLDIIRLIIGKLKCTWHAGLPPSWASGVSSDREGSSFNWAPQLQQAESQHQTHPELDFAEPNLATYDFLQTQSAQDAEYARNATLPPLESVLELTDAVRPPLRGEAPQMASTSSAGMCVPLKLDQQFSCTSFILHCACLCVWVCGALCVHVCVLLVLRHMKLLAWLSMCNAQTHLHVCNSYGVCVHAFIVRPQYPLHCCYILIAYSVSAKRLLCL